jgi:hypothetical protein
MPMCITLQRLHLFEKYFVVNNPLLKLEMNAVFEKLCRYLMLMY